MTHPLSPDLQSLLVHAPFLRRLAKSLVRDEGGASDLAQEVWLRATQGGAGETRRPRSWLARVARNLARKRLRDDASRGDRERWSARPEPLPSAAEIVERESVRRAVVEALVELPPPYREVLLLRYYEDLPPRRIAARLGRPVETVRTQERRGLERLRRRLDERSAGGRASWLVALAPLAAPGTLSAGGAGTGLALAGAAGVVLVLGAALLARPDAPVARGDVASAPIAEAAPDPADPAPRPESALFLPADPGAPARAPAGVVEPSGEPSGEAPDARPAPAARDRRDPLDVDAFVPTFLTDAPDIVGLREWLLLAPQRLRALRVEEGREGEPVRGTLRLGEDGPLGTFEVSATEGRVSFPVEAADEAYPLVEVSIGYAIRDCRLDRGSAGVQFHPDTRRRSTDVLAEGEERIVGWGTSTTLDGTSLKPILAGATEGGGWRIGYLPEGPSIEGPWSWTVADYELLRTRLESALPR